MRRVLLLSPTGVEGGAERALAGLARHLPDAGWEPVAALLENGPFVGWLEGAGCPTRVLDTGRTRQLHRTARTVRALAGLARQQKVDVIVSNQTKGHIYGGTAARLARLPCAFWQHGAPEGSTMDRIGARVRARAIVVSSGDVMAAQRALTPKARIESIQPGVEVGDVARRGGEGAALRQRLGLVGPTVGIVGRLQQWKGQDVFLQAAALVARRRPDVQFLVVGGAVLGWEGDYPASLRRFADATPELAGRVHFVGHQSDIYPWYDALDVVVHASYRETFGLVLVEAMALGRPVVAAADPTGIVEDGRSGLRVPPGDSEALANAVDGILGDPALAARLSEGARRRADDFSAGGMASRWADLLGSLTAPQPTTSSPNVPS